MRKIYWIGLLIIACMGCAGNDEVGKIDPLTPEYDLSQGTSLVDERIKDYYEQYRTYVLYDYTDVELNYDLYYDCTFVLPEVEYVEVMLDLLEEIWIDLYPTEFHLKYMPQKIFLAAELQQVLTPDMSSPVFVLNGEYTLALGDCSDVLLNMTAETKLNLKNELQKNLWNTWLNASVMEFPDAFYKVSDYSRVASADITSADYTRTRGFIMDAYGSDWSLFPSDFMTGTLSEQLDLMSFVLGMITRSSESWAADLAYPLVKEKYDILHEWFLEKYDVDLVKVGNVSYGVNSL